MRRVLDARGSRLSWCLCGQCYQRRNVVCTAAVICESINNIAMIFAATAARAMLVHMLGPASYSVSPAVPARVYSARTLACNPCTIAGRGVVENPHRADLESFEHITCQHDTMWAHTCCLATGTRHHIRAVASVAATSAISLAVESTQPEHTGALVLRSSSDRSRDTSGSSPARRLIQLAHGNAPPAGGQPCPRLVPVLYSCTGNQRQSPLAVASLCYRCSLHPEPSTT